MKAARNQNTFRAAFRNLRSSRFFMDPSEAYDIRSWPRRDEKKRRRVEAANDGLIRRYGLPPETAQALSEGIYRRTTKLPPGRAMPAKVPFVRTATSDSLVPARSTGAMKGFLETESSAKTGRAFPCPRFPRPFHIGRLGQADVAFCQTTARRS